MPQGFEAGRVSGARLLSSHVRNVTIAAESLAGFGFEPGADVTIRLPGRRRWPEREVVRPEDIHWVDRAGRPGSALVSWLARQTLPSTNSTTAYVTGEAWLCAMVYAHFVRDRGLPAGVVRAMPYWKTKFRSP